MKAFLMLVFFLAPLLDARAAETTYVHRDTVRLLADHLVSTSSDLRNYAENHRYKETAARIDDMLIAARQIQSSMGDASPYWAARHLNEVIHFYARVREAIQREADEVDAGFIRNNIGSIILNLIRKFDDAPRVTTIHGIEDGFAFLPDNTYVWTD